MTQYLISWEADVHAADPTAAAQAARAMQTRPDTIATVFDVTDPAGTCVRVDLTAGTTEVLQRKVPTP